MIDRYLLYNRFVGNHNDILILTICNRQQSILSEFIPERLRDLQPQRNSFGTDRILTVDSAEGTEVNRIIFAPWRDPFNSMPDGASSLLNNICGIRVVTSSAKRILFIIGSRQFFIKTCPAWARTLDYFDLPQDVINA